MTTFYESNLKRKTLNKINVQLLQWRKDDKNRRWKTGRSPGRYIIKGDNNIKVKT